MWDISRGCNVKVLIKTRKKFIFSKTAINNEVWTNLVLEWWYTFFIQRFQVYQRIVWDPCKRNSFLLFSYATWNKYLTIRTMFCKLTLEKISSLLTMQRSSQWDTSLKIAVPGKLSFGPNLWKLQVKIYLMGEFLHC